MYLLEFLVGKAFTEDQSSGILVEKCYLVLFSYTVNTSWTDFMWAINSIFLVIFYGIAFLFWHILDVVNIN
jgi:hypothetical protein